MVWVCYCHVARTLRTEGKHGEVLQKFAADCTAANHEKLGALKRVQLDAA